MEERSFGGERVHEGCDLFGGCGAADFYPIISMTDGSVEAVGWLPLGGYRIGIRSPSGGYFYYAHLSSYERDWKEGDSIKAGEILGFMGDTGYGSEGTKEISGTSASRDLHSDTVFEGDERKPILGAEGRSEKNQKVCILITYPCKNVL